MPQFRRENYITLNEGFHRVGRFMFPEEWTGLEATAWPEVDVDEYRQEHQRLEDDYEQASLRSRQLRRTEVFGMQPDEYTEYSEQLETAEKQRQEARLKQDQFGRTYDSRLRDATMYQRRHLVEMRLCEAIKEEEVDFRIGTGSGVSIGSWFTDDRFHICFAFSLVFSPTNLGGSTRFPAYFGKEIFNAWAIPFEIKHREYRTDSDEEQMIEWFLAYCSQAPSVTSRDRRNDVLQKMETYFDKEELSGIFDAIWKLYATGKMKSGGRRKTNP